MSDEVNALKALIAEQRKQVEASIEKVHEAICTQEKMHGWDGWPPEIAEPIRAESDKQLADLQKALAEVERIESTLEEYSC